MRSKPGERYLETAISTTSKEDLIVKTFDVLILASQQALSRMQADLGDIEGIHRALLRAQRAIAALMGALDMEIGGELAVNLFRVYEFWHHELVMANMSKDMERLSRVIPYFVEYRQTWAEAVTQFKAMQRQNADASQAMVAGASFAAVG
ncbi:MAG: flagellar export chaperone FliS [Vulcanimicrobiaceae bacterium]